MSAEFAYDTGRIPAAPMLPLRVGAPGTEPAVTMPALVDTGADMTVLPEHLPRQIHLPLIGQITVGGVGGAERRVPVYAAQVEAAGSRRIAEVLALGREALVGRDLLNFWLLHLDGPRQVLRVTTPSKAR